MTKYAHIFHLDRIYLLWDKFLVGPPYLYLFTGIAILQQLRDELLRRDFNNSMLLFSELPEINIDTCITQSVYMSRLTPTSFVASLLPESQRTFGTSIGQETVEILPISVRKNELFPRLSLSDFLIIRPYSLIVDIRPYQDFEKSHFIQSIHMPPEDASILIPHIRSLLNKQSYRFVVIIGAELMGPSFAGFLVHSGIGNVCLLTTGMDVFGNGDGLVEVHACQWTLDTTVSDSNGNSCKIAKCRGAKENDGKKIKS